MLTLIKNLEESKLNKGQKSRYTSNVYLRMAKHYLADGDYKNSIAYASVALVEDVKSVKQEKPEELKKKRLFLKDELYAMLKD